jgi:hypothetical protein
MEKIIPETRKGQIVKDIIMAKTKTKHFPTATQLDLFHDT